MPLSGATVIVMDSVPINGAVTNEEGVFHIANVPIGRIMLSVNFPSYEPSVIPQLLVTSGKEVVLEITLAEKVTQLDDVVITDEQKSNEVINEMATLSARTFSIEDASKYASSINDPARMAQNFAGVASSGDDMTNEIVIRGNSPRYMLWRLEGIEIPNPNHFGGMGSSGGPISMLSPSTLGRSDFYTGAFPAEFGNALSGVFDLRFREGNNEKRESAFMIGVLGVEASTEGPFSKKSKASYLINYRYSTLALMGRFVPALEGVIPTYQDLSFKIQLPTEKFGTFSIFGLGGLNNALEAADKDSSAWESKYDNNNYTADSKMGVAGISHKMVIGTQTYIRTVAAAQMDQYSDLSWKWLPESNYAAYSFDSTVFKNNAFRLHSMVNHKIDARNTIRGGIIASQLEFKYRYDNRDPFSNDPWFTYLNMKGNSQLLQAYAQWKHRAGERVNILAGVHATTLTLNHTGAIDPRLAVQWQATASQKLSLSLGMHSRPEHISTYFIQKTEEGKPESQPNKNLKFSRAGHIVAGYDATLPGNIRLKAEGYYQYLYNIPVAADSGSTWSILNATDIWSIVGEEKLISKGTGRNIGLDITLEKPFSNGFYAMLTGMVYDSKYKTQDGREFSTRFNGNFNANMVAGKEFKIGKAKKNTIGLNGKFLYAGGNRYTPLNLNASIQADEPVWIDSQTFNKRVTDYFRFDAGIHLTLNSAKVTQKIMLDIQNVSNHINIYSQYYDSEAKELKYFYQNGIFPVFNYRIEF